MRPVRAAEERTDRAIRRAAAALRPLEVEEDDIRRLVAASVRKKYPAI
jgi:hypothetical protein